MKIDRTRALGAFAAYVRPYDAADPKVRLKIEHTYRVAELCERIARSEGWGADETLLAWLCGLLHDVGRFEQLRRYGTFDDRRSIDHARAGAEVLFEAGGIRAYLEDGCEDELLRTAVAWHSAYRLPETLDRRTRAFCDLLRDAEFPMEEAACLYGVGGTCRASCALSDELYDEQSGYAGYPCKRLKKMRKLLRDDRKRLVSAIIKAAPDRLHTILPGMAILEAVATRYGCASFAASPYGVREGYLLHMLEGEAEHE